MTEYTSHVAVQTADLNTHSAQLSTRDLLAGPGALPDAPMAMPVQVLEREPRRLRNLFGAFIPQPARAHSRG
ncbi:hypothetical protein ERN12_10200 [Rhodobacteraceae bacterium]|nr:hypothetical protein ERN12_10200 [Paracoccaceae bacterium]